MDVLVDKQYKEYRRLSRYSTFPIYYNILDEKYVYGTTAQLDNTTVYTAHLVKRGDTLDSLALYYYNDPTKYWVIADFNRIQDPFKDLEENTILNIPTISMIQFEKESF